MTISEILVEIISQLKKANIKNPELDAEVILSNALNIKRYKLVTDLDKDITKQQEKTVLQLIKKRSNGEPVAYLIGRKEFYSLDFSVNTSVLIPRPETELLVDITIYYAQHGARVLDLGTGSGAIAIAIKYNRTDLNVFATDISEKALNVAIENSSRILNKNSIKFIHGDIFQSLKNKRFDIIVTNPPYLDPEEKKSLPIEILFEPEIALYAPNGGKEIISRIISDAHHHLRIKGVVLMEIGPNIKNYVENIGEKNNFAVSILNDYASLPRIAILKRI